jgi:TusA-related sulfurtransferase
VSTPKVARTLDLTHSEEECGDTALSLVRRTMKELAPGDVLEVRSTVAEHAFVVRAWARKTGRPVLDDRKEGTTTTILVQQTSDG